MLTEYQKRAAALAASRYRLDRARVHEALETASRNHPEISRTQMLHALVDQQLLTTAQAEELRAILEADAAEPTPSDSQARTVLPAESSGKDASEDTGPSPQAILLAAGLEPRRLGDYQILRRLGEGGMGSVYLGYNEKTGRQVAIKVLPEQLAASQSYVDRFYREARSVAQLDHPNIVRGMAVGQDTPTSKHFLVLEYVDGPSAHALLSRFGKLSVGDAVHIVLNIARGLEHAHSRRIIHRDIKPDNILLTRSGLAKLSDLGLARRTDEESHLTGARQGFGTPHYMPYEQALNAREADARSDIYALGATLYHLVTGNVPFPGKSPLDVAEKKNQGIFTPASRLNPEVPERLDRILGKMLARSPKDRYQTASDLIVDLERSRLAAAVPSFIDLDLALEDPHMRARLVSPAEPTQPSLGAAARRRMVEIWYVRYRNRDGRWCKSRTTAEQIVERLREGRLRPSTGARPDGERQFRPLDSYPEFAKAVAERRAGGRVDRVGDRSMVSESGEAARPESSGVARPESSKGLASPPPRPSKTQGVPRRGRQSLWLLLLAPAVVALLVVLYLVWK
jgi:eukaryotic-like serine/threonine-protein kinase